MTQRSLKYRIRRNESRQSQSVKQLLDIMTQRQENMGFADPSVSGCEAAENKDCNTGLRQFVSALTARLLTKCHVLDIWTEKDLVTYTQHLVNLTIPGLTVTEGFCPNDKDVKLICKAVVKDLKKKYGGMRKLETVVLSEHPAVDAAIVKSLQDHISAGPAGGGGGSVEWGELFCHAAVCAVALFLFICIIL